MTRLEASRQHVQSSLVRQGCGLPGAVTTSSVLRSAQPACCLHGWRPVELLQSGDMEECLVWLDILCQWQSETLTEHEPCLETWWVLGAVG